MFAMSEYNDYTQYDKICQCLRELGVPVHRKGYKQLSTAIFFYLQDNNQSLTKEIYPRVAQTLGDTDWRLIERNTRTIIQHTWEHRDPDIWRLYFPRSWKTPSNKVFIATLAELLQ